jgi:stage II sporulation protein D
MRKVKLLPVMAILWLCAACGSCERMGSPGEPAPGFGPTEGVPIVRVALARSVQSVPLAVEGPYRIENGETGKMVAQGASMDETEATFKDSWFTLGPTKVKSAHIIILPENDGTLVVNGSHYRGELHLWGVRAGEDEGGARDGLTVVNHVNLEHYLASVVPAEMKITWPDEALKAQAVAARTYALWRMEEPAAKNRTWDLTSGSDSQVYAGLDKESDKSRRVIVDTAGTVLTYEGKIFPAYYHSTCGGFTADAHVVFGGKEIPCLTGVPCGNCRDSPVYRWSFTLTQAELKDVVAKAGGADIGAVKEIERLELDGGERPKTVVLKGEKGVVSLPANDFRRYVGTSRMKSIAFIPEKEGDSFKITGFGWGHGVGMCQWGAAGMAHPDMGFRAEEILGHFYRGAVLQRIY